MAEPILSEQGQWRWDEEQQDWVPNVSQAEPSNGASADGDAFKRAALMDLLKTGGKNLTKIKAAQELIVTKPTEDERKREKAKTDAGRIISQLEDLYFGAKTGEGSLAYGRLGGAEESLIAKNLGLNPALRTYESTKTSVRPTLARAAGDVGNLSLPEQKAAVKQLPGAGSTREEALRGFAAAREKFGLPQRELSELAGESRSGLGALLKREQQQPLGRTALETAIPALKLGTPEGRTSAASVLVSLLGGKLLSKGVGKIASIKSAIEGRGEVAKEVGKEGVRFSGQSIAKAGEAYVKKDPLARSVWEKISPSIKGAKYTPEEFLEQLRIWNKAYTGASKVGKAPKAGLFDVLARSAREQLAKKAPQLAESQQVLARAIKTKELLGRLLRGIAFTAGAGAVGGAVARTGVFEGE